MLTRHLVLLLMLSLLLPGLTAATEKKKDRYLINPSDNIKTILEQEIDLPVKRKLRSGAEIGGTVARVGNGVVQISKVAGMELYDAVVKIDDISAVMFWVRKP